MPQTPCTAPGCAVTFDTELNAQALTALIELHARTAHPTAAPAAAEHPHPAAEKVHRPTISAQGTTEDWLYFKNRWESYKAATRIAGADIVFQLLETCDDTIRRDLNRTYGTLIGETEENVLMFMKTMAIRPENLMVARMNLQNIHQQRDEPVRSYTARLRGQASVCNYNKSKRCECTRNVSIDYSEDMVRDAFIRGLNDPDIQQHILGQANQDMTLEETLQLAEAQESGKRSSCQLLRHTDVQPSVNATSSYKQHNNSHTSQPPPNQHNLPSPNQRNASPPNQQSSNQPPYNNNQVNKPTTTAPPTCSHCGQQGHGNGRNPGRRRKYCPAYNHLCSKCNNAHHYDHMCRISKRQSHQHPNQTTTQDAVYEDLQQAGFFNDDIGALNDF